MTGPTITHKEFIEQATKAHDEILELIHIINTETLPLLAAGTFNEDQIPALAEALEVLKQIVNR
jgi:hypothetical protein